MGASSYNNKKAESLNYLRNAFPSKTTSQLCSSDRIYNHKYACPIRKILFFKGYACATNMILALSIMFDILGQW